MPGYGYLQVFQNDDQVTGPLFANTSGLMHVQKWGRLFGSVVGVNVAVAADHWQVP